VEELFRDGRRLEDFLVNTTSDSIDSDDVPGFFDAPLNIQSILSSLVRYVTGSTGKGHTNTDWKTFGSKSRLIQSLDNISNH
jgi:hypothetical protein